MKKSNTDQKRDSAGKIDIGTIEDGAIVEMIALEERTLVIKEKSIYEFILADQIDPERNSPMIPCNIQSKIIDQGSDSEIVSKIFLTAKTLFKSEYLGKNINTNKLLELSLEILQEIISLEKEIKEYLIEESEKITNTKVVESKNYNLFFLRS